MQAAKKNRVSLTALDGGLVRLAISPVGDVEQIHRQGFEALSRLVKAAGSAVDLVSGASAELPEPLSSGPALAAMLPGTPQTRAHDVQRIRAFSPAIRSGFRNLDMVLVSATSAIESRSPRLVDEDFTGAAIDADTVELACSYARRFERGSVQVVVGVSDDVHENETLQQLLEDCRERWPCIDIELLTATEAVAALMAGQTRLDVTATTSAISRILFEVAGSLSGARPLITHTTLHGESIRVQPEAATAVEADDADFPMSSFTLAAAELLIWLGQTEAANRLLNGWCRALEIGLHSPEIRVTHPYSRELDEDEFVDAVTEQLGEQPQGLSPHCPAPKSDKTLKRHTANLRLVR